MYEAGIGVHSCTVSNIRSEQVIVLTRWLLSRNQTLVETLIYLVVLRIEDHSLYAPTYAFSYSVPRFTS